MDRIVASFERLKQEIKAYNPHCDFWLIEKAYNIAVVAHAEQTRASGEPFVIHPLEVARILASIEMDADSIVAALLHDTVEDTKYTNEDIRMFFGDHIAEIVEGLTKLEKINSSSFEERQIENLQKMFLAMSKDIRVIIIKLADRLHNMQTLKSKPREKQLITARETMEVFAPIAHRLGISKIKWELEDLCLRYLDPVAYAEITELVQEKRIEREHNLEQVMNLFKKRLVEMGIEAHVEGRVKHFYSIYRKMYTQGTPIDDIFDLYAVRIIVNVQSQCYEVLGAAHEMFTPIPGRVKDYIAMPKANRYQSLHSSLMGPFGKPFEVQIRTWDMHRIAEVGIAAHWKYKEGTDGKSPFDDNLEWIRHLIEMQKDFTGDAEEFMRTLRVDLFADEVFVFSPKGDVYKLPVDSTPIDYAYAVHSAIGNRMTGAKVNSRMVNLEYKLQNGDIVDVITSSVMHGPKRDWLKIIKTSTAKRRINEWFKKEHRDENIAHGKEILEREFKRAGIPVELIKKPETFDSVLERHSMHSYEDMLAIIGYGGFPANKVVTRVKEQLHEEKPPEAQPATIHLNGKRGTNEIIVSGLDNCSVHLAHCCNPVYGDDIIGFVTRGRGVTVHRSDCINVLNVTEDQRLIDTRWSGTSSERYSTNLQMVFTGNNAAVEDVLATLRTASINMPVIYARTQKNALQLIDISIEVGGREQLDFVIKQLQKIKGITSLKRTRQ